MADFQGGEERGLRVRMSEQKLVICGERPCGLRPGPSLKMCITFAFSILSVIHYSHLE